MDLTRLKDFFSPGDLEWKPVATSKKTGKALAAVYITNRAIMDRLDEVCGPENWKNEFEPGPGGGIICGLSIYTEARGWITKWDGAENTDVQAVKGGLSSAMRRAAVQWGIGRYLYDFPQTWVPVDQCGKFTQPPPVPREFLPPASAPSMSERLVKWGRENGVTENVLVIEAANLFGADSLDDLTVDQGMELVQSIVDEVSV